MNSIKLLCIGDSLTEGYGIDQSDRWSNQLRKELDIEVFNEGISGDTTAGILSRFIPAILSHRPTHAFIMGGTNDLSFDLPTNLIVSNLKAMLRQARFYGVECILGIPTPYFRTSENDADDVFISSMDFAQRLKDFQKDLRDFAEHDNTAFVDFSTGMDTTQFLADGIHPNAAGNLEMSRRLREVIEGLDVL